MESSTDILLCFFSGVGLNFVALLSGNFFALWTVRVIPLVICSLYDTGVW